MSTLLNLPLFLLLPLLLTTITTTTAHPFSIDPAPKHNLPPLPGPLQSKFRAPTPPPANATAPLCQPSLNSPWTVPVGMGVAALRDADNNNTSNAASASGAQSKGGISCANIHNGSCTLVWSTGDVPVPGVPEMWDPNSQSIWQQTIPSSARIYVCGVANASTSCAATAAAVQSVLDDPACSMQAEMMNGPDGEQDVSVELVGGQAWIGEPPGETEGEEPGVGAYASLAQGVGLK